MIRKFLLPLLALAGIVFAIRSSFQSRANLHGGDPAMPGPAPTAARRRSARAARAPTPSSRTCGSSSFLSGVRAMVAGVASGRPRGLADRSKTKRASSKPEVQVQESSGRLNSEASVPSMRDTRSSSSVTSQRAG